MLIELLNRAPSLPDSEVPPILNALSAQVGRTSQFATVWGISTPALVFTPSTQTPKASSWWIILLDSLDVAGALGYHDTTPSGLPLAKVDVHASGAHWSITASHELLEMLVDPEINSCVQISPSQFLATEVCDAPEGDAYAYDFHGVKLSDYVYPEYFFGAAPSGTIFDHSHAIAKPYQILQDGYLSYIDFSAGGGWQQVDGPTTIIPGVKIPTTRSLRYMRPEPGSRRERRAIGRERWVPSTVEVAP
jgi:hypothetical protein